MSLPLNPSNGDVYTNSLGTKWKYSTVNNQWRIYALEGVTGLQGATGMAGATGPAVAHGVTVGYVPYASGATGWGTSNIASSETGTTVWASNSAAALLVRDGVTGTCYSTVAAYNSNDYVGFKIKRECIGSGATGSDNTWYMRMPPSSRALEFYDAKNAKTVLRFNDDSATTTSIDFYGAGSSAFLLRDASASSEIFANVLQSQATGMECGISVQRNVSGSAYNEVWKQYLKPNDKNLYIGNTGTDFLTFDNALTDVYTKAWQGYSGSVTGISGSPISYSVYTKKFGRMVDVQFSISGNSNSTVFAFDLPYSCNADIGVYAQSVSTDLNTLQTSPGRPYVAPSSKICRVGKNNTGSEGWTVTGIKGIDGSFFYQANA